jgi:hypothetical protein
MTITTKVNGLQELRAALLGLTPRLRRRVLRNTLAAGARVFRDEARRLAPILRVPVIRKGVLIRKPGTLRKAIRVRTSKASTRAGNVGVFVNVVPAKGSDRGRYSPNDPFYWRFQKPQFLGPAAGNKNAEAVRVIEQTFGPQMRKLNVKGGGPL